MSVNMRPRVESDTHILDWLEQMGYEYDVLTDEDMHYGGIDVLKPYAVILMGSHPEYYSKEMYYAVYDYTQQGAG
jgi:N,N-dimethylformamidase